MSRQSRETLRAYFREGHRPTEDEFGDLIDSALNINDEGFSKTAPDGLRVTSLGESAALMSFYSPRSTGGAEWRLGFGDALNRLTFERPAVSGYTADPLVTIEGGDAVRPPRMGIGISEPRDELDVEGAIRSTGRRGAEILLPADGEFHPLAENLQGCNAFEVVAGVGDRHTGRFALVHAIAMNTYNPIWWEDLLPPFAKKRIRHTHAYYTRPSDRLQLRWAPQKAGADRTKGYGDDAVYQLQIRTRHDYRASQRGDGGKLSPSARDALVRAYVTRLWFDDMTGDTLPFEKAPK
ncbi:hypothetical protein [Phenylobacterium sp.]|uniref:hypothetical protein n=1 Tax=Phenylobacterium sp. TaxID=1871053 RepID=UPI0025CF6A0B|nr:hypothetical protein [Phenylobacterium sp.]